MRLGRTEKLGVALLLALVVRMPAQGLTYTAPLERAAWSVEQAPRLCRLRQQIPLLGDVVFESRAGADERFFIASADSPLRRGPAQLAMVAPHWNPEREGLPLGPVSVSDGALLVSVEGEMVRLLQEGLQSGLAAELRGTAQSEAAIEVRVSATPVYFRRAFDEYRSCIDKLPVVAKPQPVLVAAPAGDLTSSQFVYGGGVWELSPAQRGRLDQLAQYLGRADAGGSRVVIDGYGGDSHRRLLNLELSRKRAQGVSDYLGSRGVAAGRIVMRYHGDQQGQRREVLIRLEPGVQAKAE